MDWTIEWKSAALKEFKKLPTPIQVKLIRYLNKTIQTNQSRSQGKPLRGIKSELW